MLENGLKLKKANLRGVESDGMMMSEQELGFEEKSPGIVVLPDEWIVGAPLQDYLPVSEAVLELELTSNRPDCFSIYGIAREVAAAARRGAGAAAHRRPGGVRRRSRRPRPSPSRSPTPTSARGTAPRVIRGVTIGESPAWLKARLTHAGMRPINNVVDVTNYVMLGWGQPLHAFDAGKIRGGKLIARRAAAGEKIVTLDGVERTLDDQMLVIADVERALVIAGVFGSVDAEIDEHTTDIVLEAANFAGPSILRTEMHTGIRSEASNRFEKGLDANLVPGGLDFAGRLFAELCGGTVAPGMVDAGGVPPAPRRCRTGRPGRTACSATPCRRPSRPASCAGSSARWTRRGDGASVPVDGHAARSVPTSIREVDLIEEVGRIAGYGMAPETLPRHTTAGGLTQAAAGAARRPARPGRLRPGRGHHLHVHRPGRRRAARAARRATSASTRSGSRNPMSVEQSVMRTMLLPGLLGAVRDNVDRLNDPPNLFEIGKVYLWDEPVAGAGARRRTRRRAAARARGARHRPLRAARGRRTGPGRAAPTDFYTLKGVVDAALAARAPARRVRAARRRRGHFPFLHPGKAALVSVPGAGGVGALGQLRPDVAAAYGVDDLAVYFASLNMDRLAAVALKTVGVRGPRHLPAGLAGPRRRGRAATCRRRRSSSRPAAPAASSCAACASSTCTRATRCRRTSARWRCASSCARRSAR